MEAEAKLAAEASPEEVKLILILGWKMDFRELIMSLPDNKYIVWSADIGKMLTSGSAKAKELETLIGRLGHLGMIIPFVYHFLSRLREWQDKSRETNATRLGCRQNAASLNIDVKVLGQGTQRHRYELDLLQTTDTYLPLRFVSFWSRRVLR